MSSDITERIKQGRRLRSFAVGDRVIYTPAIYKGEPNRDGVFRLATIEAFEGFKARLSLGCILTDIGELEATLSA